MTPLLSIVVPSYDEAPGLGALVDAYVAARPPDLPCELVLVDNGSRDETRAVLAALQARGEPYRAFLAPLVLADNQGYGGGIRAGLAAARGEYLAWSHADLQCEPGDVFNAFARLRTAADPRRTVVKGRRAPRPWREAATTIGMQAAARVVLGPGLTDINAQPKVFHRSLLALVTDPPRDFSFDLYVLYRAARAGWRIETVPVRFHRRAHGASHWAATLASRRRHIAATLRFMVALRLGRIR
ncbi:MAG TPA: glycosyltransferase family 2 protein [Terriglobales bacterium]|nr:glycosyltransferase family 2 protein [Terriglobales bacterium]